jgi:hypothetical protein
MACNAVELRRCPTFRKNTCIISIFKVGNERWAVHHDTWKQLNGVLHKSLPLVCTSIHVTLLLLLSSGSVNLSYFTATQRRGERYKNNRGIVGPVCSWVCVCNPLSLLSNNSEKILPPQRRIVEGDVFCAVRVVSKENKWPVLPKFFVLT